MIKQKPQTHIMKNLKLEKDSPIPIYSQISQQIRDMVHKRVIKPNERLPGEFELAHILDINRMTVNRIYKNLEIEGLILRAPGKGTFVAERLPETITIGIITGLLEGMIKEEVSLEIPPLVHFKEWMDFLSLRGSETNSILINIPSSLHQDKLMNFIERNRISGIVVMGVGTLQEEPLNLIKEKGIPSLVLGDTGGRKDISFVTYNDYVGAFKAAQYLAGRGHKKISILIGTQTYHGYRERLKGYKDGLTQGGIEAKDMDIIHTGPGVQDGYLATQKLLSREVIPAAILCCNDFQAFGAIKAIREKGMNIPEEIAIVGYDDLTFSCKGDLPLTTVRIPKEKMVEQGLQILSDLISQKQVSANTLQTEMEPELVIRKTA